MENIHRFLPITDWAVVLPANPIAPAAWSTARICAGDGPAVPVRQSFRRDEGDPECFLLQLCAPFPPGSAHSIALSPSHLLPYLQGSWSFFITQCRKVPHVWARICSMSPSSGSQSITRGGQGGFPKCDPSSQQCERNSERATGSPAAPGVAAMAPQSAVLPQQEQSKEEEPSGASAALRQRGLVVVQCLHEHRAHHGYTEQLQAQRRAAQLPWSQRSLCRPGEGAECCRGSWRSVTHP